MLTYYTVALVPGTMLDASLCFTSSTFSLSHVSWILYLFLLETGSETK